ncbi:MAG: dTDP-4-dehydrorhamnose reductase [Gammaproteobacteria bacterium]|nr:MAG: dTDP-4-dehydrorhamnose reductase [Gammaproteobacteria bacterium]
MRFLIVGGRGQLGRCLVDCLGATDHEYLALGREGLDITDSGAVLASAEQYRPDVMINAAAYTAVDRAETEPEQAWLINSDAVANLAEAANAVGAQLIHVSTDYVFDGKSPRPYIESDPVNPLGVYGESKLAGERRAEQAERFLIVRTAWVFSEYGNNFVKTMLRLGAERDQLSIVADQYGTPTYAGDLAATLIKMTETGLDSGTYHFSGGEICSWYEFAEFIFHCAERISPEFQAPQLTPITTAEYPTLAARPAYSAMDNSKLKKLLPECAPDWKVALENVTRRLMPT